MDICKSFMFDKCSLCRGNIAIFGEKYYANIGTSLGSFEITDSKPLCRGCHSRRSDDEKNVEAMQEISILMQKERYPDALDRLKSIYDSKNPGHNYNAANIFVNLNQFDKALQYYDRATFLDTHYLKAWYRKGMVFIYQRNCESAVNCFENVIILDPNNHLKWTFPALFRQMMCLIHIHNTAILEGRPSNLSEKINRLLLYFYPKLSEIQKFNNEFSQLKKFIENKEFKKWIEKYVDFCNDNYSSILDEIEPDILFEIVGPNKDIIRYFTKK